MPSPSIAISVSTSGSLIAGSEFNLTCVVYELFTGLTGSPVATWTADSNALLPGTVYTSSTDDMTTVVLRINPIRSSYPTSYTCSGSLFSPAENRTRIVEDVVMITIQSKIILYVPNVGMY